MEGGRADGQAVAWRSIPCATQGHGYATATSRLRDSYGTPRFGGRLGSGQRRREPCRRRGNCDARVCRISYAAGAAPSLAVTPLRTNGTSAAAGRITGPAGVAVPAPVLGRRLGSVLAPPPSSLSGHAALNGLGQTIPSSSQTTTSGAAERSERVRRRARQRTELRRQED